MAYETSTAHRFVVIDDCYRCQYCEVLELSQRATEPCWPHQVLVLANEFFE